MTNYIKGYSYEFQQRNKSEICSKFKREKWNFDNLHLPLMIIYDILWETKVVPFIFSNNVCRLPVNLSLYFLKLNLSLEWGVIVECMSKIKVCVVFKYANV